MTAIRNLPREQRKSHYRNLVSLAMEDGKITPEEEAVLEDVARKWDVDAEDILDVIDHLESNHLVLPETPLARFHQLYDLIDIMIAEEGLRPCEHKLCRLLADALGFPLMAVDLISEGILEGARYGMQNADVHNQLRREIESICA